jgi:hypothetical protein
LDIDGHQRTKVLRDLQSEGYEIPPLPVVWIEAEDEKEAKERVLLASSVYGEITPEGLSEYLTGNELDLAEIESMMDLPNFDLNAFRKDFYLEGFNEEVGEDGNPKGPKNEIERMGLTASEHHDYIVLLFDDLSDFLFACNLLEVRKVDISLIKKRQSVGLGRVVSGRKFISKISEYLEPASVKQYLSKGALPVEEEEDGEEQ